MSPETAAIWSGILSGSICGGLALVGAIAAVKKGLRDLEETEIRRQRVECITSLYGLRFVLCEGYSPRPEDTSRFMFELNRAGALFAEQREVLNGLRDFYDSVRSKNTDATNRLVALIKNMAQTTRLAVDNLSDADVRSTFMLPNPNVVVQFIPVTVQGPDHSQAATPGSLSAPIATTSGAKG